MRAASPARGLLQRGLDDLPSLDEFEFDILAGACFFSTSSRQLSK